MAISTDPTSTEDIRYIIRGGVAGRERLRILSRVMAPTTLPLLDRAGVPAGGRVIDIGCGGGDVTLELARRVGARGSAVGVDLDDEKLALARDEGAAAGRSVEYRRIDVTTEDLGTGFELAYVRFLLTHVADPAAVCAKLHRAIQAGGAVVVEDIDFSGCFSYPDSAAFRRYREVYIATARARGADPCIGPRVPELLAAAGFEDVRVSMVQPIGRACDGLEGDTKVLCALTMENIVDAAVAEDIGLRSELDGVTEELYRMAADPDTVMTLPRIVQVTARRP